MATRKSKNKQWTTKELNAVKPDWKGDQLSDGNGLVGKVKTIFQGDGKEIVKIEWNYGFRWGDKKEWFYCGMYPDKSIKDIRDARDKAKVLKQKGINPRLEIKAEKIKRNEQQQKIIERNAKQLADAIPVQKLFDSWIETGVSRKDDNKGIKSLFNNHFLGSLGEVLVKDLTDTQLITCYKKIIDEKKYKTAIELHKDVSQMLRWASERQPYRKLLVDGNPASLIKIDNLIPSDYSNVRERVLSDNEITLLKHALKADPVKPNVQAAIWLCLSCTCRIGELIKAEWKHVDFVNKTWFIPAKNSKGKEKKKTDHTVYLSDFALSQFQKLKSLAKDSKWCFPAIYTDSHVCQSSFSKAIGDRQIAYMQRSVKLSNRIENNDLVLGNEVWTVHDLRRTSASIIQRLLPASRDGILISQLCLHHSVIRGAARHYLFHQYESQMREAWTLLGKHLESLTSYIHP